MKLIISMLLVLLNSDYTYSQPVTKSKDSCTCTFQVNIEAPADDDTTTQIVIVEFDVDSNCVSSNPVIAVGASKARNEAALKFALKHIAESNKCVIKCRSHNCEKYRKRLPITFRYE